MCCGFQKISFDLKNNNNIFKLKCFNIIVYFYFKKQRRFKKRKMKKFVRDFLNNEIENHFNQLRKKMHQTQNSRITNVFCHVEKYQVSFSLFAFSFDKQKNSQQQ